MKRFSSLMLVLMLLFSCGEDRQMSVLLHDAEQLMDSIPDSAYHMLDDAHGQAMQCPRRQRMHYELLRAKAQNKAYVDFTTDSIMKDVAAYYDRNGSPNQRMMAHYLLGCTYRDMGEAPMTLQCYMDAVDMADTTRTDCDYRTMMIIYGQMADLYMSEYLPDKALAMNDAFSKFALKANDTCNFIRGIELQVHPLAMLGDTTSVFNTTEKAHTLYLKHGMNEAANGVYATAIQIAVQYGMLERAKIMMDKYESSGFFCNDSILDSHRAQYYYTKGNYFLEYGQIDSAEYFFRKLRHTPKYIYEQNCGLYNVYLHKSERDSIAKYSTAIIKCEDSIKVQVRTDAMLQVQSMYNYARNQRIAHEKEITLRNSRATIFLVILFSAALAVCAYVYYQRQRQKHQRQIERLATDYAAASDQYRKSLSDLELAKDNYGMFIEEKTKENEKLQEELANIRNLFGKMQTAEKISALERTKIVQDFREMAKPHALRRLPSESQWDELSHAFAEFLPMFHCRTAEPKLLTDLEFRVALLTRLEIPVNDIALLLECSSQSVTNAKRRANQKLFNEDNAQGFISNILGL